MSSHLINCLPSPVIFAHRGDSKHAPENTLAAFELAFKSGAPAIELDVMLTMDEEVVVIHDHRVDRTTNGQGFVNLSTLQQLKKLDAGSKFSTEFRGEKIPTLDEVLDIISADRLVNIELKNYHSIHDRLIPKVVEIVNKRGKTNSVMYSSFSLRNILKIRKILPNSPAALITLGGLAGKLELSPFFSWISPEYIHPDHQMVTAQLIQNEHGHHRKINVWTVDDEKDMRWFFNAKIDGLMTNDPALAVKARTAVMIEPGIE
jgi:glycerophosphoryl diester phosphodiesterase